MRKTILRSLIALCICSVAMPGFAQEERDKRVNYHDPDFVEPPGWSIGMNFGLSDLWGDVGTKSPVTHYANSKYWESPKFMGGLYLRYAVHPAFAIRLGGGFGTLYANDNWNEDKAKKAATQADDAFQRYARNQDIKDYVWEGTLLMEITPFRFSVNSNASYRHWQPYLLLGIGGYHFAPYGTYYYRGADGNQTGQTKWMPLYNLNTEGQGFKDENGNPLPGDPKKYSLYQFSVPLGVGVRWDIGKQLGLGVEYLYRYCFTDYLDNVSGTYIDPKYFDSNLPAQDALAARDISDKSWTVLGPSAKHSAGELRGNSSVKDAFSTLSISFFYKIKSRKSPWWY